MNVRQAVACIWSFTPSMFVKSCWRIRCLQLQEAFKLRLQPSQVVGIALGVDQSNKQTNQAFVIRREEHSSQEKWTRARRTAG